MKVITSLALYAALVGCSKKDADKQAAPKATETGSGSGSDAWKPDNKPSMPTEAEKKAAAEPAVSPELEKQMKPEMVDPKPAGKPFFIDMPSDKKPKQYPVACATNILPAFVVMYPSGKGVKDPCAVDGEDDFAFSLEFHPCGEDPKAPPCVLPPPGAKFKGTLSVTYGNNFSGDVDVIVVKHEKPYLHVRVDRQDGDEGSAGGDLKILIDDKHPLVDAKSWK